ncbi:hypothetical protein EVAR_17188_1 [Eumeta japonica]|uniref:Uncharacterized protein n=1 Tax=Eumeta variegata TaxID=151549 RepID=A0A4C1UAB8_EUMVA|nr:hypothetical protein EVAR_17188_1 [Eumeta japonica]
MYPPMTSSFQIEGLEPLALRAVRGRSGLLTTIVTMQRPCPETTIEGFEPPALCAVHGRSGLLTITVATRRQRPETKA